LWDAVSAGKRGGYAESAASLEAQGGLRDTRGRYDHDQGIAGLEEQTIVNALEKRKSARDEAAG
jgi:UDP-N-acetylmuramoyl-tripeptide--D-alanyl-D-alanine ligase